MDTDPPNNIPTGLPPVSNPPINAPPAPLPNVSENVFLKYSNTLPVTVLAFSLSSSVFSWALSIISLAWSLVIVMAFPVWLSINTLTLSPAETAQSLAFSRIFLLSLLGSTTAVPVAKLPDIGTPDWDNLANKLFSDWASLLGSALDLLGFHGFKCEGITASPLDNTYKPDLDKFLSPYALPVNLLVKLLNPFVIELKSKLPLAIL